MIKVSPHNAFSCNQIYLVENIIVWSNIFFGRILSFIYWELFILEGVFCCQITKQVNVENISYNGAVSGTYYFSVLQKDSLCISSCAIFFANETS